VEPGGQLSGSVVGSMMGHIITTSSLLEPSECAQREKQQLMMLAQSIQRRPSQPSGAAGPLQAR